MNLTQYEKQPLQDHCGILAALSSEDTSFFTLGLIGLKKLQTRGYDGTGFATIDHLGNSVIYKREGLVDQVFKLPIVRKFASHEAKFWLFQVRYGTTGAFSKRNVQPFLRSHRKTKESFVVVHNGQFSPENGDYHKDDSDTLEFARQLARSEEHTWDERIAKLLRKKKGAWSLAIGTKDALYIARDPMGIRPLSYGALPDDNGKKTWVAASETSALTAIGIPKFFEVMPGELIRITKDGPEQVDQITPRPGLCIFETVYIMKGEGKALIPREKDTDINSSPTVDQIRARIGTILAREAPVARKDVDFVIGIPGTGITGGEAYARALNLPYSQAITDRVPQDDQRTFMYADVDKIYQRVLRHFNFDEKLFIGKRVVLVDDSIVRGNIMKGLVDLLRKKYSVKDIHIRILCPPIDKECYLGVNIRNRKNLLAASVEKAVGKKAKKDALIAAIGEELGVNSLAYISDSGLREAITGEPGDKRFCMGCMVGHVPPVTKSGEIQR